MVGGEMRDARRIEFALVEGTASQLPRSCEGVVDVCTMTSATWSYE